MHSDENELLCPSDAPPHVRLVCDQIQTMVLALSGSGTARWFPVEGRRELSLTPKHGDASLEERAVATIKWLFALFNVDSSATRALEKYVALEFTTLVEHHYVVWKDFEEIVMVAFPERPLTNGKRKLAYAHEVIYKASLLWSRLLDLLFLHCRVGGNVYDASVGGDMNRSYERSHEMRAMLADPPLAEDEGANKKKRDLERIIAHLLEQARTNKFRKRGNIVYNQKHVQWAGARYATNAWVPASFGSGRGDEQHTMESFVLYFCKKDLYELMS